jgi:endonuclease/exonuclease/phosphatase family metal-dependent hydrolase
MNTINIRTWNVDWFRNGKRTGEDWKYCIEDCDINVYNGIVREIKSFLDKESAVVFLQEVPYQIKQGSQWLECDYHKKLYEDFPSDKYEIAENTSDYVKRCTIAIFKKGVFVKNTGIYKPCNNRTISLKYGNITLLGVHMPTNFRRNDSEDNMWLELIDFVKEAKNEKLIIAGDFNSYIGCKEKLTEKRFLELCRLAKDIVPDDIPTFIGGTPIDHIFLNFDPEQNYHVETQPYWVLSDHKYVQVELNCSSL